MAETEDELLKQLKLRIERLRQFLELKAPEIMVADACGLVFATAMKLGKVTEPARKAVERAMNAARNATSEEGKS